MAYSSIMGADKAPIQPSGRSNDLLGPSDNSDSGSDALGTAEIHGDSDAYGTGERGAGAGTDAKEGGDILPDRVVRLGGDDGLADSDVADEELTDLDGDAEGGPGEAGEDEA